MQEGREKGEGQENQCGEDDSLGMVLAVRRTISIAKEGAVRVSVIERKSGRPLCNCDCSNSDCGDRN